MPLPGCWWPRCGRRAGRRCCGRWRGRGRCRPWRGSRRRRPAGSARRSVSSLSAGMPRPWSRTSMRASSLVEVVGGEAESCAAGGGELDGVGDEVGEGLQDAVGVGPDADAVGARGEMRIVGALAAAACCRPAARARRSSTEHMVSWSSALPEPMRSRSRMSLTRRTRRSVLPMAMSIIWCIFSGRA